MRNNIEAPKCPECGTEHGDSSSYVSFHMFTGNDRERRRVVICSECGSILWMTNFEKLTPNELNSFPAAQRHELIATRRLMRALKMARN
ncbi:MAG TPA: hypothetical protein VEH27_14440 [Methylomirabilota bacterium]|nr:hypothetical protein [Methylomirabilota bacterium]